MKAQRTTLESLRPAQPGDPNYPMFDRFTLAHGAVGAVLAGSGASFGTTLLVAVLWELVEPTLKAKYPKAFPAAKIDSPQNKIGDGAAVLAGWYAVRRMRR